MTATVLDKINRQFSKYPKRIYPKGQILIFGGEEPEHIFYIVKGRVREYDVSYRGDEVIVNVFKPPAFFPMSWAINKTSNRYFYKTEAETIAHLVPVGDALKFLRQNADVSLDLLGRVYRGVDGVLGRIVHLMSGTAKTRLIYEMIVEVKRFGEKQRDGSVLLDLNESDLASRAGLTRETVSREMAKLKTKSLVSISNSGIRINNPESLEKMLDAG